MRVWTIVYRLVVAFVACGVPWEVPCCLLHIHVALTLYSTHAVLRSRCTPFHTHMSIHTSYPVHPQYVYREQSYSRLFPWSQLINCILTQASWMQAPPLVAPLTSLAQGTALLRPIRHIPEPPPSQSALRCQSRRHISP